jgi:hypothetical protein
MEWSAATIGARQALVLLRGAAGPINERMKRWGAARSVAGSDTSVASALSVVVPKVKW